MRILRILVVKQQQQEPPSSSSSSHNNNNNNQQLSSSTSTAVNPPLPCCSNTAGTRKLARRPSHQNTAYFSSSVTRTATAITTTIVLSQLVVAWNTPRAVVALLTSTSRTRTPPSSWSKKYCRYPETFLLRRPRGYLFSSAATASPSLELYNDTTTTAAATTSTSTTTTIKSSSSSSSPVFSSPKEDELLLDPKELCPVLVYPKALSPSSIAEFRACPQSFLFQYLYGIKQPTNLALLKGRLCHSALEQLYDLPPLDRTTTHLHNLFRKNYKEQRDEHLHLFQKPLPAEGSDKEESPSATVAERTWGQEGLQLLTNYMNTEDATCHQPAQREVWVQAKLPVDDDLILNDEIVDAALDQNTNTNNTANPNENRTFLVRGIVDRLDLVKGFPPKDSYYEDGFDHDPDDIDPIVLAIVDYKTSQQPNLKYSPAMNRRIKEQSFFQLQIYALLLHERQIAKRQQLWSNNSNNDDSETATNSTSNAAEESLFLPVRYLRLMYLNSNHGRADSWTKDMGSTGRQRKRLLDQTRQSLQQVYRDMKQLIDSQDPTAFVGCQRSFCYCHTCRPRFRPGSVWEPPSSSSSS